MTKNSAVCPSVRLTSVCLPVGLLLSVRLLLACWCRHVTVGVLFAGRFVTVGAFTVGVLFTCRFITVGAFTVGMLMSACLVKKSSFEEGLCGCLLVLCSFGERNDGCSMSKWNQKGAKSK